jgi:hypothetical protein
MCALNPKKRPAFDFECKFRKMFFKMTRRILQAVAKENAQKFQQEGRTAQVPLF